jgi:putative peptidoglycan lipid II flippase
MTLASRLFGLVRDVLIGRIFGDTLIGSAFAAAFAIPNMFRRLFGEGALSAAFIPEYTDARKRSPASADHLARLTLKWLAISTGLLTALIELSLLLVLVLAPGDEERSLSLRLLMVMLPFMPLICMTAILAGMLQVRGRYALAASGPIVLNAFIIVVGLYYTLFGGVAGVTVAYAMGIATVLSGLTQALTFWFALSKEPIPADALPDDSRPRARAMLKRFIPVMIGLGTLQLNTFIDTLICMWPIWVGPTMLGREYPLDDRSQVILSLTSRLYQFPLGVFGIAVATAAFPLLAKHANEPEHFLATLRRGLRLSLLIGLPASIGLVLVRHDLVLVMFSGGKSGFSPEGVARSASVLLGFACAVWAYSLNHVLTRAFYAVKDTRTPMNVSLAMVGFNIALNFALIWSLREAGLAWATAASATLQFLTMLILASRRFGRAAHGPILDAPTLLGMTKVIIASLVMGACVWTLLHFWPAQPMPPEPHAWRAHALSLSAACIVGGSVYLIICWALRVHELRWLIKRS